MKVKDIPTGAIVWYKNTIVGIKGATLPSTFDECNCRKVIGNGFDYELLSQEFSLKQMYELAKADAEQVDAEETFEKTEAPGQLKDDAEWDTLIDELPF